MTEFELRMRLRELQREEVVPQDVWANVLDRIGSESSVAHRTANRERAVGRARERRVGWQALAASAMIATIAIAFTAKPLFEGSRIASSPPLPENARAADRSTEVDAAETVELARELARNPVLAATDAEIRQLQEQLQLALARDPDSATLRRMVMRTEAERRRLLQYQSQLG